MNCTTAGSVDGAGVGGMVGGLLAAWSVRTVSRQIIAEVMSTPKRCDMTKELMWMWKAWGAL